MAATAPFAYRVLGRHALAWCATAPLAAFVWLLTQAPGIVDGRIVEETLTWVPALGLDVVLRLDAFALLMALLVTGIGVLVFVYAHAYFEHHEVPAITSFTAWLTLFAATMLGFVLADEVFTLFVFWELTSVTSFFLIGFHHERSGVRAAARQAFLVTALGGLALLAGLVLISQAAGTTTLSEILAAPPDASAAVTVGLVLVLVAAFTKSAQFPFHFWLPAAMVAPTPVSGYLHSATMVKAGIYVIARFAPAFGDVGVWRPIVLTVGLVTMVLGAGRAYFAHDLKQLLAFSTISQLGLLTVLFGAGATDLAEAACLVLLAHALAKAALFMVVGIIDRQAHTRDVRELSGIGRRMPMLAAVGAVAAASLAGIGPVVGFVAKERAFEGLLDGGFGGAHLALVVVVLASCVTFAYCLRFVWGAFATKDSRDLAEAAARGTPARPALLFLLPPALLAGGCLLFAVAPGSLQRLVVEAARAIQPQAISHGLSVVPHVGLELGASLLVVATGAALFAGRRPVAAFRRRVPAGPSGEGGYETTLRGLNAVADRVTAFVQHGSLPVYVGVVLATFLLLPGSVLVARTTIPSESFEVAPMQVAIGILVVGAALAITLTRQRFAAVLALGALGYGIAILWVLEGAPDLAVTQILVETVTVVVFVLVLRHLPTDFAPPRPGQLVRIVIAGMVGVMMALFVLVATGARVLPPISTEMVARSVDEGGGRNVVNVILVDFRAWDTLGEITVLAVAGLGITSLVLAARSRRARTDPDHMPQKRIEDRSDP